MGTDNDTDQDHGQGSAAEGTPPGSKGSGGGFAGWTRRHKTPTSVKVGDGVARSLITLGGFGTIVSVIGMCLFLVWVVAPMFMGGRSEGAGTLDELAAQSPGEVLRIRSDEYLTMAWALREDGSLRSFRLDTGETLDSQTPYPQRRITAASFDLADGGAALGFADGSIGLCQIEFVTNFLAPGDDPELRALEARLKADPDTPVPYDGGMVQYTNEGQLRQQTLVVTAVDPVATGSEAPVLLVDKTDRGNVTTLCSLTADGRLRLTEVRERKNLMTGKVTLTTRDTELPAPNLDETGTPAYLKLSGQGDTVYLLWDDGRCLRYDVRDQSNPVVAEDLDLVPEEGVRLTSAAFLLGKTTLLVGDSRGVITAWHRIKPEGAETSDGALLVPYHRLDAGTGAAVTSIGPSQRRRKVAVGYADGSVALFYVTSDQLLAQLRGPGEGDAPSAGSAVVETMIAPKEDMVAALDAAGLHRWRIDFPHPEPTLSAIFGKVWYEGYTEPDHTWQSTSGSDDFEPKYGLIPLIFGTIKATIYAMLFAVPVALLAAVFTSEFLNPRWKRAIKPTVELMASLPSVVLGFIGGLVLAQLVEDVVPAVLLGFVLIPFCWVLAAHLWQLLPRHIVLRWDRARMPLAGLVMVLAGGLSYLLGPVVEALFFAGDIKLWLDGQLGSGVGGWLMPVLPLCAITGAWLSGRYLDPYIGQRWAAAGATKVGALHLVKFLAVALGVVLTALFLSWVITLLADPRGLFLDTYVQRNALVVGIIMGFAVIPIIYTIAEDALSAVPEHLRGASLGAGATQWQTAMRIVIPTAMSGIFSAIMIGFGRAVGETMIVLMAAGNTAIMEMNIFNGFRTLSANIAVELPEAVRDGTNYRMLFLAALTLFTMTFVLNTVAETIRLRFRKRAFQL